MNNTLNLKPGQVKGDTGIWEMVIGLEIHAQISSKSKLFSGKIMGHCIWSDYC